VQYLIDTDWVIDHLHRLNRVVDRLEDLAPNGLGLSIVSLAELYEGMFYSRDPQGDAGVLHQFLDGVNVLPLDDEVCRIFARERGRLRAEGSLIGDFDLLIASTAMRHGLTLLTNNRRHFGRVQGLNIVSV
jgi:tRNA(fMet)-specific endonuclease VapC